MEVGKKREGAEVGKKREGWKWVRRGRGGSG